MDATELVLIDTSTLTQSSTGPIFLGGSTDPVYIETSPVILNAGVTYEYYAVSEDLAGNIATSTIGTFIWAPASSTPSASISATDCGIATGASSCDTFITWDIQDATTPNAYDADVNITYFNTSSGTNVARSIAYGLHTIEARDDTSTLNSTTVTASCADPGAVWNVTGGVCEEPVGSLLPQ